MASGIVTIRFRWFSAMALIVMGCFMASWAQGSVGSAEKIVIKVAAGGGYTLVNFPRASGYPDSNLDNWNQANYCFSLQGLWRVAPNVRIGGEAGWEQLYYWYYIIPYDLSPVYREANRATMFVGPVAQFFLTRCMYVLCGADLHFFDGSPAFGVSAAAGVEFRLSDNLALPIEFRVKPIFGKGTPTVLQLNIGVAFGSGR